MEHKDIVRSFFALIVAWKTQEAYDRYISADFVHHNQYTPTGRQWLLDGMLEADKELPNKSITVHLILEEWDKVITYSHVKKEIMNIAVMHIFRFDAHDMIVEMRDLWAVMDPESPNTDGMF